MYINKNKLSYKRYSSGELKLEKSKLLSYVKDNYVEILFDNKESIFELELIIDYYISNNIIVELILSYLPYQRMDHKDRDELDTVYNVYNILSKFPLKKVVVCEPHCDISLFKGWQAYSLVKHLIPLVKQNIEFNEQNDIVVFSDKGAKKRYESFCGKNVYFSKERDINTGLICKHSITGDINPDSKCLIIDDIISTGDTLIGVVDILKSYGVKEIFVLSGHIENNKYNKRLLGIKEVRTVYSTNSLKKKSENKLKLYDIKEIIYG